MSQLRAMRRGFRAAFAVAAVYALLFSLLVSGAIRPAHAFADYGGVACDHSAYLAGPHVATGQDSTEAKRQDAPAQSGRKCPDCCLAAHASSAVLPERVASVARPAERPSTIHLNATAARPPESLTSSSANGARAPPSV